MGLLTTCDGALHLDSDKSDIPAHSGCFLLRSTKAPAFEVGLRRCVTDHPDTSAWLSKYLIVQCARTAAEFVPRFLP